MAYEWETGQSEAGRARRATLMRLRIPQATLMRHTLTHPPSLPLSLPPSLATELAGTNKLAQTVGVGTPYYMSPELVNNQRYDERSDIWSVGCIIYELAALRPPFDAANQVRRSTAHTHPRASFPLFAHKPRTSTLTLPPQLALAVKINAGQYKRLPSQYTEELERTCGWMLRRDISRRPKVEDLERLPNLVLPLREARVGLKEIDLQNQHTKNNKKEEALAMKEKALEQREAELKEREAELKKWEERLEAQAANGVAPLGAALPPPPPVAAVASKKRDSSSFRIPHMADETAAARNDASSATRSKHVYSGGNERENVAPLVGKSGKVDFETYSKRRRVVNGAL